MNKRKENYIFLGFGVWFLLITFLGFAPSFYLRNEPENLPLHLTLHGIVFSLWILLFMVQTLLIFTKKVKLHMAIGIIGLLLILIMIPIGFYPVLYKVSIGAKTIDQGGHNLFGLCAGYIFFFCGFYSRKNAFLHKRLMLFATIMFTTAAIDRIAFSLYLENFLLFRKGLTLFPAIIILLIDLNSNKKRIGLDIIPFVILMGIYYFADYFWLSDWGKTLMKILISLI